MIHECAESDAHEWCLMHRVLPCQMTLNVFFSLLYCTVNRYTSFSSPVVASKGIFAAHSGPQVILHIPPCTHILPVTRNLNVNDYNLTKQPFGFAEK